MILMIVVTSLNSMENADSLKASSFSAGQHVFLPPSHFMQSVAPSPLSQYPAFFSTPIRSASVHSVPFYFHEIHFNITLTSTTSAPSWFKETSAPSGVCKETSAPSGV